MLLRSFPFQPASILALHGVNVMKNGLVLSEEAQTFCREHGVTEDEFLRLCPGPLNPIWVERHQAYLAAVRLPEFRRKMSAWVAMVSVAAWFGIPYFFLSEEQRNQPPGLWFWVLSTMTLALVGLYGYFAITKWSLDMAHDVPAHDIPHDPNMG